MPHIKEGEYVNEWTEDGESLICGKCKVVYSLDAALDAEWKKSNVGDYMYNWIREKSGK